MEFSIKSIADAFF